MIAKRITMRIETLAGALRFRGDVPIAPGAQARRHRLRRIAPRPHAVRCVRLLAMSIGGTASYNDVADKPPLVARAVAAAQRRGFESSCRVEQGRLLFALAAGAVGSIGETGTGCGVGLAWLVSARQAGVSVVSVERDAERAAIAREIFQDEADVAVLHGDWTRIYEHGPFDLLIVDGGGNGKQGPAADPTRLLRPGGSVVIDDMTPMTQWPPMYDGRPDSARLRWLEHEALLAAEVRVAPDLSTIIGTLRPPRHDP